MTLLGEHRRQNDTCVRDDRSGTLNQRMQLLVQSASKMMLTRVKVFGQLLLLLLVLCPRPRAQVGPCGGEPIEVDEAVGWLHVKSHPASVQDRTELMTTVVKDRISGPVPQCYGASQALANELLYKIAIAVDCSGSINARQLGLFEAEIQSSGRGAAIFSTSMRSYIAHTLTNAVSRSTSRLWEEGGRTSVLASTGLKNTESYHRRSCFSPTCAAHFRVQHQTIR
jgi:hypothetical protein